MPSILNYTKFIYVNVAFILILLSLAYFRAATDIKDNWPLYRCNPTYWIFSTNISDDFQYCVQSSQLNSMNYLLQPLNYMVSSLGSVGGQMGESINNIRNMFNVIRNFVSSIIENVFGVFFNLIVEFQKIIISLKDMVSKMIGIVVTMLYVLDGSVKTMNSAWSGPPGQMVKALGTCFDPNTNIRLKNGQIFTMENIPLGSEIEDGSKVFSVMKIDNPNKEVFYIIPNKGINNSDIYVTGEHYVYDNELQQWLQVKDYSKAILTNIIAPYFTCLITTNRRIQIGNQTFWDWEDDIL